MPRRSEIKLAHIVLAWYSFSLPAKNRHIKFKAVFFNNTNYNCYYIYIELTIELSK
jgi:hypothetical protein